MTRHEIPTHLDAPDRALLGLTMRQLLAAACGLALAYGALADLPLPLAARLVLAACVLLATAALVLWRPAGRPLEEWAFVLLRYHAAPRVSVWRPRERPAPERAPREVVLAAPPPRARAAPAQEGAPRVAAR
ncbi:MAG: PrgI family protein [Chloroflexi bacterium]|nr:PrgI family protein [Chloroflexota bacterium]